MSADGERDSFDDWFASMDVASELETDVRPWFTALFRSHGPVGRDVVQVAWQLDRLAAAERAVARVLADVHRTSQLRPVVHCDDVDGAVVITVDGDFGPVDLRAWPWDEQRVSVEVAEYVQDMIMSRHSMVWPVCSRHDVGVHADLDEDSATWRCRVGGHAVGLVGLLGAG